MNTLTSQRSRIYLTFSVEVSACDPKYWDKTWGYWKPGGRELFLQDRATFLKLKGTTKTNGIASPKNADKVLQDLSTKCKDIPLRISANGSLGLGLW